MSCECQDGRRVLRVRSEALGQRYPEFVELSAANRWTITPDTFDGLDTQCLHVPFGGDAAWQTISEFVNFLRTVLTEQRMQPLVAAWLPQGEAALTGGGSSGCASGCSSGSAGGCAMQAQADQPLLAMSPLDATALVSMLRENRIETWYQPVFFAGSHELWGHECLMRGRADDGSLVSPGQLLDWARQERLIFMLDRVCRETHIANAAAALPEDASILINFLPTAIYEPVFCLRTTKAAVKRAGIEPGRVIFEVVESEAVTEMNHLRRILDHYREGGFRIALDDVGSGYAGLTLMAELSPDLIKIDRELVINAPSSKMHRIICNALCEIARQSGKLCLAEGIETAEQYDTMRSIGADLVQGFYFAKPAPDPALTTDVPIPADAVCNKKLRQAVA